MALKEKINTIVFDIGNVLVNFRWKEYLIDCGYEEEKIQKISNATVNNRLWKEWDRGAEEAESLIEQCCKQEPEVEAEIRKLFDEFQQLVVEYDYSVELIKSLKQNGYKVYLLSNYSKRNFEAGRGYYNFINHVDGGVISYEVHSVKPEAAIYEELINKYGINPEEAIFLDDLEENLKGARVFGFHTILVKSYEQMIGDMKSLGVKFI